MPVEEVGGGIVDTAGEAPDISFTSYVLRGLSPSDQAAAASSSSVDPAALSPFNSSDFKHESGEG